jgi:hypothetical protein
MFMGGEINMASEYNVEFIKRKIVEINAARKQAKDDEAEYQRQVAHKAALEAQRKKQENAIADAKYIADMIDLQARINALRLR